MGPADAATLPPAATSSERIYTVTAKAVIELEVEISAETSAAAISAMRRALRGIENAVNDGACIVDVQTISAVPA